MFTVKFNYKEAPTMNMMPKIMLGAMKGINKLNEKIRDFAIKDYLEQRKPGNPPQSLIVKSFMVVPAYMVGTNQVWGHVVSGGPIAPYAIYVDQGHGYKNGKRFGGYHFMEHAAEHGKEVGESIIMNEINKTI